MTTATAPGKIILFGEHAVVYGRPALAVPLADVAARVVVSPSDRPGVWFDAPDVSLRSSLDALPADHPLAVAARGVFAALGLQSLPSCRIDISSTIPVASGLGSGAAVSVALIRALAAHLGAPLPDEQVNALAYEVEKLHHGTPSGIDNTVITYARPVFFVKGQPIETFVIGAPFTLVIGDTGRSGLTRESVGDVRRLWEQNPRRMEAIFDSVAEIVRAARAAIAGGEVAELGPLMDRNHALLQEMTVSSPELDRLVEAARAAGARGAKLSGGGRGGNMIALAEPERAPAVVEALQRAGARRALVVTVR